MGKGEEFSKRTGFFKFKNLKVLTDLMFELLRGPGNLMSGIRAAFSRENKAVETSERVGFVNIAS